MCGITGIVGIKNSDVAREKIAGMNDAVKHRGPDADGTFVHEKIALGHRRLSIIDLNKNANQPLSDHTGRYVITYNGEIYNYLEIRKTLVDYPFQTNSDTEVILAAYAKHGGECLSLLNGMFAFAIWDKQLHSLFVARDRLGVKPLYYTQTADGCFVFASEIRAILKSGLAPRTLCKSGLHDYLMYQSVYSPKTIVENIFQLRAGECGVFKDSQFTRKIYWRIEEKRTETPRDPSKIKARVRTLLTESVQRRMISDVPLGAFLSGGIDSGAIVALMSETSTQPVSTFSVAFDEKEFDESEYAQLIAKKFNTRHNSVRLAPGDFLDELPNALMSIDSPSGDGINTYVVSKATKNAGIKVALSGLGGDELFAGYEYFKNWFSIKKGLLPKTPLFLRRLPGLALSSTNNSKYHRFAEILSSKEIDIAEIYPIIRQVLSPARVLELLGSNGFETQIHKDLDAKLEQIENFPLLSQFSISELLGYTQNVLLKDTDQFSMASALEVREPFFDYKLVEYVLQIPDEYKYPTYPKSLLVESISPLLPQEIVHRKKMGFVLPWERWMRNDLREFCRNRLHRLAERGILSGDSLITQWDRFVKHKAGILWSHLWHLVVLEEWLETNEF